MYHGYNTFEALQFVPFITFNSQTILPCGQWAHIPSNVITPAYGLHPVHTTSVYPHQITRSLRESVNRNIIGSEFFKFRPPRAMKIVYIVLFTKSLYSAPVSIRNAKPFTIAWPNVYIDGAEIVVFLVTGCPASWNL